MICRFAWCGKPALPDDPYCQEHQRDTRCALCGRAAIMQINGRSTCHEHITTHYVYVAGTKFLVATAPAGQVS